VTGICRVGQVWSRLVPKNSQGGPGVRSEIAG